MATGLSGRVARLEAAMLPQTDHCRACGLRHASGPMTIAVLRSIIRVDGGRNAATAPRTPLCLCDPCCGDPKDRLLARMSHGMSNVGER
jgi:hypothetical protein